MLQAPTQQLRQMEPVMGTGGQSQLAKGRWRALQAPPCTPQQPPSEKEAVTLLAPAVTFRRCFRTYPEIRSLVMKNILNGFQFNFSDKLCEYTY